MTVDLAAYLTKARALADRAADQAATHRAEAERLMAESLHLAVESVHPDAPPAVLDESTRLHRQGIVEHGRANAHAMHALMLRAKADRVEAAAAEGARHG